MAGAGKPNGPRRTTITDVARAAGVSPATISRVLNDSKRVSPDVASRVLAAVEELGYRPNPAAQVLLRGASHTIGVVVPDLSNPYFAEVLKAVTDTAASQQHRTLVADTNEDPGQEMDLALELARWVDGLVLCSPRMTSQQLKRLVEQLPRTVLVNRVLTGSSVPAVTVDFASGMRSVLAHLAELGHRDVAYLAGPPAAWSDAQRRRAVRRAVKDGLQVHEVPCGSSSEAGYAAVDQALAARPTALVAFSDYVALGALARLNELGVSVPEELSLVGFDDLPFGELVRPRLTTVSVVKAHLGKIAFDQLLTTELPTAVSTVPATLVVRESTAAAPTTRRRRSRS